MKILSRNLMLRTFCWYYGYEFLRTQLFQETKLLKILVNGVKKVFLVLGLMQLQNFFHFFSPKVENHLKKRFRLRPHLVKPLFKKGKQ